MLTNMEIKLAMVRLSKVGLDKDKVRFVVTMDRVFDRER